MIRDGGLVGRSNLFFVCDGLIVFGPNFTQMVLTIILLLLSWTGSIGMLLPQLQISSLWLTLITPLGLLVLNLSLLLMAASTEPGILIPDSRVSDIENRENQALYRSNYCSICRIVKPPRARHCRICGHCVLGVDHHCPWIGICIGVRNYALFFLFVVSVAISSAFNVVSSVVVLLGWFQNLQTSTPILRACASILGLVWFSFTFALVMTLLTFHLYLMYRRQTTVEYLKDQAVNLSIKSTHTSAGLISLPTRPLQLESDWSMGPCCCLGEAPPQALAIYGCCPPRTRMPSMWRFVKEDKDDIAEDSRREALLRQIEEALLEQIVDLEDQSSASTGRRFEEKSLKHSAIGLELPHVISSPRRQSSLSLIAH